MNGSYKLLLLSSLTLVLMLAACAREPDAGPGANGSQTSGSDHGGSSGDEDGGSKKHGEDGRGSKPGDNSNRGNGATSVRLTLRGGRISGPDEASVELGSTVEIVVTSDVADEIHVHGYDLMKPVGAGKKTRLRFVADIPGEFEVELEESGKPLLALRVQ
jgi:hypothetical protein